MPSGRFAWRRILVRDCGRKIFGPAKGRLIYQEADKDTEDEDDPRHSGNLTEEKRIAAARFPGWQFRACRPAA